MRAGTLDWDVERTITHMIGATAKYTLYLASRSDHFIAMYLARWLDATNQEILASIAPVAAGLAAVAGRIPPDVRAYHVSGPTDAPGFIGKACVELLVHTDDVPAGYGIRSLPRPGSAAGYSRTSTPIWPRRGTPGRACCAPTAGRSARQARRARRTRLISSAGHWWPSTGCGTYGSSSRRISSSLSCSSPAASASCR